MPNHGLQSRKVSISSKGAWISAKKLNKQNIDVGETCNSNGFSIFHSKRVYMGVSASGGTPKWMVYNPRPPEDLLIESSNPHSHPPNKIYPKTILRKYLGQLGPTGDNNHILTLHTRLIFSSNFATPICTSHQIRFAHHVLELHVGLTFMVQWEWRWGYTISVQ